MQAQTSPRINFLEIVDDYIVYAIGNAVYQIQVTAEDLEEVFGTESHDWECNRTGRHFVDTSAAIVDLSEVHESDYHLLITTLKEKAEDVTSSYEGASFAIRKFKSQRARLDRLAEKESQLRKELAKVEETVDLIMTEPITAYDLIGKALDEAGVENYRFLDWPVRPTPFGVVAKWVNIGGVATAVHLSLEDGILEFYND